MSWDLGAPLGGDHRSRLLDAGVEGDVLESLDLREVTGPGLPDWWTEYGNALYLQPGMNLPAHLIEKMTGAYYFRDALLVVATGLDHLVSFLVGGDGATVFVGPRSVLTGGEIYCGGGSTIVLNSDVVGTRCPFLDARNGGSIVTAPDQLWAANVYVATDDMHRLEDAETGARVNPFGAHIRLGRHVWLGRDVSVTGHVDIGDGAVVGAKGWVRNQKIPANTAVAGMPAKVIREGVTWRGEDTP